MNDFRITVIHQKDRFSCTISNYYCTAIVFCGIHFCNIYIQDLQWSWGGSVRAPQKTRIWGFPKQKTTGGLWTNNFGKNNYFGLLFFFFTSPPQNKNVYLNNFLWIVKVSVFLNQKCHQATSKTSDFSLVTYATLFLQSTSIISFSWIYLTIWKKMSVAISLHL